MKHTIEQIITDAAEGDCHPLIGLIDHLLEKGVSLKRIMEIGETHFHIPASISLNTFRYFV